MAENLEAKLEFARTRRECPPSPPRWKVRTDKPILEWLEGAAEVYRGIIKYIQQEEFVEFARRFQEAADEITNLRQENYQLKHPAKLPVDVEYPEVI